MKMREISMEEAQAVNGGVAVGVAIGVGVIVWYYYGGGKEAIQEAIEEAVN